MLRQKHHYFLFFLVHVLIGVVAAGSSAFTYVWGLTPIVVGLIDVVWNRNQNERAACWAAYATGIEVVLRMREAFITFESAKYFVIILLLTGLIVGGGFRKSSLVFVLLLFLLLPAVLLTDIPGEEYRKAILFNLSGPLTLIAAGLYFYERSITRAELSSILIFFVMPIVCTAIVLQFNTPDFSSIKFNAESNFETSGGFGPNQVSTILGCGAFIILLALILKLPVTGFRVIDFLLLALFTFRGIITFSRGGMLSVAIAMSLFITLSFLLNHPVKNRFVRYLFVIVPTTILIWGYLVDVTGGQIENRYLGKNAKGKVNSNLTSGRADIISADYQIFLEHPLLGAGVGMSKILRERKYGYLAASHSEFSRLLAEHGMLGITFLLVSAVVIIRKGFQLPAFGKIWLSTLIIYTLLTINHTAMRIALPGFVFGFAFVLLVQLPRKKLA